MEINLVAEGLKFMVLGMGVVFVFLALLVQMMKWQKRVIDRYFPLKEPSVPTNTSNDEDPKVAAIIAAVKEFRKEKTR